ncbi:MAG: outer membrane protein assembly factor BamE [Aeromonadales bacterium]|nr:outer membrane protein assembly factor BamE [Aeromonadales bacterium]
MQIKKIISIALLASTLPLLTTSCAYRAPLTQGNYVEQDLVNKLTRGMTREQVRFVLGTPMLIDPYDNSRWYYVHFNREGWNDPEIKNLVLLFAGDNLADMSGDYIKPTSFDAGTISAPSSQDSDFNLPEE